MKNGNWIPISKAFLRDLPHDRQYTRLEAAYSLQVDYDCKNSVTVAGYSALWSWSRTRVSKFLNDMNVVIIYPKNTQKRRNQKGHIAIHKQNIKETYKKHIRLIENNYLDLSGNIKKTKEGHKKDIKGSTTKEPINLNPNPILKNYPDEIKNFTTSYQEYVLNEFPKIAPKIENSLIEKCCDAIDKLIRLDNFTFKEIFDSIQWASQDDFWKDQILSLAQLRKKAGNGNKKFINMFTAYQKKDTKKLSAADQRLQSNIQAGEDFENGFK